MEQLRYYSYALLMLAKGRAFRMHLENIEHLLNDPPHTSAGVSTHKHEQGQEEDFDGVLPPQKLQSYIAWLQLMVSHFDAADTLSRFVCSNLFIYNSISIHIMLTPSTSSEKLNWQTHPSLDHTQIP